MSHVYLIASVTDPYVVEFDSWQECLVEFEERLREEPYRVSDELMIIADAAEVDPFDSNFKSDTVLIRTDAESYLITYNTSIHKTFEDFREEVICDIQDLSSEYIFCGAVALTYVKKYKGEFTFAITRQGI